MKENYIYADCAASAPVSERAKEAFLSVSDGNPSSAHEAGRKAAEAVEKARSQTASLLGCSPEEVFFTSGGTESDNTAVFSGYECGKRRSGNGGITISAIEHPAVLEPIKKLENCGAKIRYINADEREENSGKLTGRIVPEVFAEEAADSAFCALMLANNETGVIQPVADTVRLVRKSNPGVFFHCDAVQAVGHIPVDVRKLGVDTLALSGHKLHAYKGIGALYIMKETLDSGMFEPYIYGGGQQRGMRSGTIPASLIASLGEACAEAEETLEVEQKKLFAMTEKIYAEIKHEVSDCEPIAWGERLPGTLDLAFPGCGGEALMLMCDMLGLCVSAGSACHAGSDEPSHVQLSMGVSAPYLGSSVRISISRMTAVEEAEEIASVIVRAVGMCRM